MATQPKENQVKRNTESYQEGGITYLSPITVPQPRIATIHFIILGTVLAIGAAVAINLISDLPNILIFGGAIGLFLAILIFQKPELGAYILIFSVFTNLSDLFTEQGLPSVNKPMVALVVLSIFANYILKTGNLSSRPKISITEVVLGIYLLSIVTSAFVAVNQPKSFTAIIDLIKDVAVGYCIYITLDTKAKVRTGVVVLLVSITFVAILGVIHTATGSSNTFWGFAQQSAYGQISESDGQLRYAGPIGESNIWGQVLVSILPIGLYMITKSRNLLGTILPSLAVVFILLAMIFTESRGATLALAFVLLLIAIDLRISSLTFLLLATSALLLLFILPEKYTERIKSLDVLFQGQEYGYTSDESINGRRAKLLVGLAMFTDNPFLGVGFANYGDNYLHYGGKLGLDSFSLGVGEGVDGNYQAHSLYVEILAETGIFGISSFLTYMGLILAGLYRLRKNSRELSNRDEKEWSLLASSVMMSLVTFLLAGIFLHGIGFRFIWVLIGLSIAFISLDSKNKTLSFAR